jgi:hypothetical protein
MDGALPGLAAIVRAIDAEPGVAGFGGRETGKVDGAVVIGAAEEVGWVAGGGG